MQFKKTSYNYLVKCAQLIAIPSYFFKKHFFKFPYLVILNMILKLNIKIYFSKKSLFLMEL